MIHKAPCGKCYKNLSSLCRPYECKPYREHKEIMIAYKERRLEEMKCKKCRTTMVRKQVENVFYYECPQCGNTLGKPVLEKEEEKNASENK